MKKRITTFLLSLVMLFAVCLTNVSASGSDITDNTTADYKTALSLANMSSFHGSCNLATAYQLLAIGVYKDGLDFSGSGDLWYDHFSTVSKTSGGYSVITIGGKNCLYDLVDRYGNELYNIVYCLGTGGSSGPNHCLLIRAIINGQVYFADSFGCTYSGTYYPEGTCTVLPLDRFVSSYRDMNGDPHGCVYFTNGESSHWVGSSQTSQTDEFVPGNYTVTASALNIRDSASTAGNIIGQLDNLETITVTEIVQNWGRITYQGKTGWICMSRDGKDYVRCNDDTAQDNELIVTGLTADQAIVFDEESITWTAKAIGGDATTYSYAFTVYREDEVVYESNFSSENTFSYQAEEAGVYQAKVTIVDGDNAKAEYFGDEVTYISDSHTILFGDVDGDGTVSPADARIALRTAAGMERLSGNSLAAADFDGDSRVSASDARKILRVAANLA